MTLRSFEGWLAALALSALLTAAPPAEGQLRLSGQVDLLALAGADDRGLNQNFRGDSPFNAVRVKLFTQHWFGERIGVFGEILLDHAAPVRLNGAYVVVNELAGQEWLNVRAGLAPSLIGSFGLRSTYFNSNPLIGVPLAWQHRTTLDGAGLASADDLLRRRDANAIFLPMLYDACWNVQWEVLGEVGAFEYSFGVTPGSMSNPTPTASVDGVQWLGRVGYGSGGGLRVGLSGGVGPYIGGPNRDPLTTETSFPASPHDYDQGLVGADLEYALGKTQLLAEIFRSSWELPHVPEKLVATSGYVEGRHDFLPDWYGAVRVGAMTFNEITGEDGGTTGWDDDIVRFEAALTHRLAREVQLRVGWQRSTFLTGDDPDVDLLAIQLRAVF